MQRVPRGNFRILHPVKSPVNHRKCGSRDMFSRREILAESRPADSAAANGAVVRAAALRYVNDGGEGMSRRRVGGRFAYFYPGGKRVRDPNVIARLNSLAIPPAYTRVWICPDPDGHIQATARDARGRKQYRYHPRWREVR